jgi:hypothetical protein
VPPGFTQAFFQALDETAAIGEAGQWIMVGEIIELALGLPALGNLSLQASVLARLKFFRTRVHLDFKVYPAPP